VEDDTLTKNLFAKIGLSLFALSVCGALLILPYVAALEGKALALAAQRAHVEIWQALAISVAQSVVLLGVAVFAGLWASRQLDLRTPLFSALFSTGRVPERTLQTLLLAFGLGIATALVIAIVDRFVFHNFASVSQFVARAQTGAIHPARWQGFLASFYGALDEEILMRLGLLSLLALAFRTIDRLLGADAGVVLPSGVFWVANIVTAVLFGLGHLPATAAIAPLTGALVVRSVVLNGAAGLVFGWLYRRFGLEWAMASHFGADLVLHVVIGG
jgi:membrane protease YdiL (CAAX protease family)